MVGPVELISQQKIIFCLITHRDLSGGGGEGIEMSGLNTGGFWIIQIFIDNLIFGSPAHIPRGGGSGTRGDMGDGRGEWCTRT